MATRKKFYVVWKGQSPGVYESWDDCHRQVTGFPGSQYKSFPSRGAAEQAFQGTYEENRESRSARASPDEWGKLGVILDSLCVDAACSGNPGVLEFQCVETANGRQVFHEGPFPEGTVNIGEFLAIVHALAHLKETRRDCPVYSDSMVAIGWVHRREMNTKLPRGPANEKLFELGDRALDWLAENRYSNKVVKWQTAVWGEIPADFGRK